MPVLVACPSCGVKLSVPAEIIGHTVRCASCSTTFAAHEPPSPWDSAMQPTTEERYIEGLAAAAPPRTDWPPEPQHDDYPPHDNDYDDERRYIRRDLLPH